VSTVVRCAVLVLATWAATSGFAQQLKPLDQQAAVKTCSPSVTDECVVRYFKDTQEASVIRGRLVFQNYCVLCHGPEGKGNGRAAKLHTPPPFNLTLSAAPRDYISQVVRKGGEAMGRGKGMPPWGDQLTDEQINDTLNYLFSIRVNK
jgi:mono/diheme cytochrome c family protein